MMLLRLMYWCAARVACDGAAELIVEMLNAQVHPRVPSQGSVGASGDLAPLAHLALAMIGEAPMVPRSEPVACAPLRSRRKRAGVVNGTQAQTGMASLLTHDAWVLWRTAHAAAAMSLEAVGAPPSRSTPASTTPVRTRSSSARRRCCATCWRLEIRESHRDNDPRVQDAYSLRCTPQVLGAVGEALAFAEGLVTTN